MKKNLLASLVLMSGLLVGCQSNSAAEVEPVPVDTEQDTQAEEEARQARIESARQAVQDNLAQEEEHRIQAMRDNGIENELDAIITDIVNNFLAVKPDRASDYIKDEYNIYNNSIKDYYEITGQQITDNPAHYNKLKEAYWNKVEQDELCNNSFWTYYNVDCANKPNTPFERLEAYISGNLAVQLAEDSKTMQEAIENDGVYVKEEEKEDPKHQQTELTFSKLNAVRIAQSYINNLPFSRKGLIEQLEYEGFSNEDATYAVDNIVVDWNKQCVLKAKGYLEMMGFSRKGLKEQLEYEGFSNSQIEYALEAVGY